MLISKNVDKSFNQLTSALQFFALYFLNPRHSKPKTKLGVSNQITNKFTHISCCLMAFQLNSLWVHHNLNCLFMLSLCFL